MCGADVALRKGDLVREHRIRGAVCTGAGRPVSGRRRPRRAGATAKVGDVVRARALAPDGGCLVRGKVLDVGRGRVLLDLPHGKWCLFPGVGS